MFSKNASVPTLLLLLFTAAVFSETPTVVPRTEIPPIIDGKLDDEVWETAFTLDGFKTLEPDYGLEPSMRTEVFLLYDSENIYFAARCFDSEPKKIKSSMSNRDNMFSDDFVAFILDTFNDKQDGYAFLLNPLGIQGDGIMNVAGNLEPTHDMVWYSKGQIDNSGFTVECRVPLKSIRFPGKKTVTMRVVFFRQIVRTSETVAAPPIYPDRGGILTQSHPISLSGLKYQRVIEVLPAFTHSNRKLISEGQLKQDEKRSDVSITAKVGITSDLTMDATYNPDFSQVEADAGQVDFNRRYALFFPEKRQFFLEGNELFQFAGSTEEAPLVSVIHTRNIIDPLFGLKLSGKFGRRNTFAAIYARDDLPGDNIDTRPDFAIFRYRRALKNDSYIGAFYAGREAASSFNRIVGSDGRFRLNNRSVSEYHLFGSFTRAPGGGSTENGHAMALRYNYETRRVVVDVGFQDISKKFRVDTGYLTRTGISRLALFSMLQFYPKSKFFKKIEPFYWSFHLYDKFDNLFETVNLFTLRFRLPRSTQFRIDTLLANEVYSGKRFDRSGIGFQANSQLTKQLFIMLFFRHTGAVFYDPGNPLQGKGNRMMAQLAYQPLEKLNLAFSVVYSDFFRKTDNKKIYDYTIVRSRNTFQLNKYLFLRGIVEYNFFQERLTVDGLISFTYIPGTVVHIGYGSALERIQWVDGDYLPSDRFLETQRGFFFKISYLWRL